MRFKQWIEMAMPLDSQLSQKFYHGVNTQKQADHNIQSGSITPLGEKRRGHMAPMEGMVYLTPKLSYAIIYALGGDVAGSSMGGMRNFIEEPYGYVFVADGSQLKDVYPDEDSVGELANDVMNGRKSNEPWWLLNAVQRGMTPNQIKKIKGGEYAYYASGGKRLIKKADDTMLRGLMATIGNDGHIAHKGPIKWSEVWRIDKSKSAELKKDGSNFFDLAERIA